MTLVNAGSDPQDRHFDDSFRCTMRQLAPTTKTHYIGVFPLVNESVTGEEYCILFEERLRNPPTHYQSSQEIWVKAEKASSSKRVLHS